MSGKKKNSRKSVKQLPTKHSEDKTTTLPENTATKWVFEKFVQLWGNNTIKSTDDGVYNLKTGLFAIISKHLLTKNKANCLEFVEVLENAQEELGRNRINTKGNSIKIEKHLNGKKCYAIKKSGFDYNLFAKNIYKNHDGQKLIVFTDAIRHTKKLVASFIDSYGSKSFGSKDSYILTEGKNYIIDADNNELDCAGMHEFSTDSVASA